MTCQSFAAVFFFIFFTSNAFSQAVRVKDINPGPASSQPGNMRFGDNGILYFFANDGVLGNELWKTDGTDVGTTLIKDIYEGPTSSVFTLDNAVMYHGLYCFNARDAIHGAEFWKSDGTTEGTQMVLDIRPGINSAASTEHFFQFNDLLWFNAFDGSGPANGFKIFYSNATASGTGYIQEAFNWRGEPVIKNNVFYMAAYASFSLGYELWKSDGTPEGTELVKDICPDACHGEPEFFTKVGNQIFFAATGENSDGQELWKTDGTATGTVLVKDIYPGTGNPATGPTNLVNFNGLLYFFADDEEHGRELWKSDGTTAGTEIVLDINADPAASVCCFLQEYDGKLYFAADDGVHGKELFSSDGTAGGTQLLKDIRPDELGSNLGQPVEFDGKLFFSASDGVYGQELWSTDGTLANTALVQDIKTGISGSNVTNLTANSTHLYFTATDNAGIELWKYAAAVLPVELTDFVASVDEKMVRLFWQTAQEKHHKGFEIQRSDNLEQWAAIGFVESKNAPASYHFTDKMPESGINYYRLKQIDRDGAFEFSKIVSATLNKGKIQVTQANRTLYVSGSSPGEGPLNFLFHDLSGRLIARKQMITDGAGNGILSLEDLQAGMYVTSLTGEQTGTWKISIP